MIVRTTATRLSPGLSVDRYGDESWDWSNPVQTVYADVLHYPSDSTEVLAAGRTGVMDGHTIHLPYGSTVSADDRFLMDWSGDLVWVVDGTPAQWPIVLPGWDHAVVVKLKKLEG